MITVFTTPDAMPAVKFREALRRAAPDLVAVADPTRADLLVTPRWEEDARANAWYDLTWAHPALDRDPGVAAFPDEPEPLAPSWTTIRTAGTLGAPPVIPAEDRIAAAAPVTLDGVPADRIRFLGGPEAALGFLTARRDDAIRGDRSADAYDWDAHAAAFADRVRALTAPRLTPAQRAHVAAVRLWDALAEVDAARQSVAAHLANAAADHSTDPDVLALLERRVRIIDPPAADAAPTGSFEDAEPAGAVAP